MFVIAWFVRRDLAGLAWVLGLRPAIALASENIGSLSQPMILLYLILIAVPSVAGGLNGISLSRRVAARRPS